MLVCVEMSGDEHVCPSAEAEYDCTVCCALEHGVDLAARDVDAHQVRVALIAGDDDDRLAVGRPDRPGRPPASRRALIAADRSVDVEVDRPSSDCAACLIRRRSSTNRSG